MLASLIVLAPLLGSGLALPTDTSSSAEAFVKRDAPCNAIQPFGGSQPAPVEHFNGQPGGCPIKNKMDDKGGCTSGYTKAPQPGELCAGYCEVKLTWFWGKEVPINEVSPCSANSPCEYTTTKSIAVTQTFEFNAGIDLGKRDVDDLNETELEKRGDEGSALKGAFSIGASYSYSTTKTSATGLVLHRPDDVKEWCGHWTFVPVFVTSCGSLTTGWSSWNAYGGQAPNCPSDGKTTPNWCNTTPMLDANGDQMGKALFVLIDCKTEKLGPKEKQDPVYQYPGVAINAL